VGHVLLWGSLALAVLLGGAYYVVLYMPGHSHSGPLPPLRADELIVRDNLTQHVQALAGQIGERNISRPASLDQAVRYIEATWHGQGYGVVRQPFDVDANRDQFCASALERAAHEWVARILEPNLAVATEQDVANQAQRVLVPVGDQDLPRRAGYAAGARNISCNGVP